ncbi:hypothetical protein ABGB14_44905 [Nonomuraea sp. B10E15]|uniref:hypothetical protein n=1 Tax=unclassified Nonomuraea TaxID=2593643 RepID=UPI00325E45D0
MEDLMHRVETQFASQLSGEDGSAEVRVPEGIAAYYAIAADDGTVVTVTLFETEEHARRAGAGAERIRQALADFQVEELGTVTGEVAIAKVARV